MKTVAWISISFILFSTMTVQAQKATIYGEVGLGFGQTLFFGDIEDKLRQSLGGSFEPNIANNLMMAFYIAPENWKGLGIGSRIKGSIGTSVEGDFGDGYLFNYYNLAIAAKYYPFSQQFNKGIYGRGSIGFGQVTTKRENETTDEYRHQYAIGGVFTAGAGYTIPFKKTALSIEAEFEIANRNGTISGVGDGQPFQSGQLSVNFILSF